MTSRTGGCSPSVRAPGSTPRHTPRAPRSCSRVATLADDANHRPDIDLRATGVHVRTLTHAVSGLTERDVSLARAISAAARDLGLSADPSAVQAVQLTIDALDKPSVMPFWRAALEYEPIGDDDLVDAMRRDPAIWFQQMDVARPLRNRVHLDVGVPPDLAHQRVAAVKAAGGREMFGQRLLRHPRRRRGQRGRRRPADARQRPRRRSGDRRLAGAVRRDDVLPDRTPTSQAAQFAAAVAELCRRRRDGAAGRPARRGRHDRHRQGPVGGRTFR